MHSLLGYTIYGNFNSSHESAWSASVTSGSGGACGGDGDGRQEVEIGRGGRKRWKDEDHDGEDGEDDLFLPRGQQRIPVVICHIGIGPSTKFYFFVLF